jgi:hypothetical protein
MFIIFPQSIGINETQIKEMPLKQTDSNSTISQTTSAAVGGCVQQQFEETNDLNPQLLQILGVYVHSSTEFCLERFMLQLFTATFHSRVGAIMQTEEERSKIDMGSFLIDGISRKPVVKRKRTVITNSKCLSVSLWKWTEIKTQ